MNKNYLVLGDSSDSKLAAPAAFDVLRMGKNKYTKNGKAGEFELSAGDLKEIVGRFGSLGRDLVVDFDHSTLNSEQASLGNAPAAGWVELAVSDDGSGVLAKVKKWTDKAKGLLEKGEYRYISPVIQFDKDSNGILRPMGIQSIALTNHPAIHNSMPLMAASDIFQEPVVEAGPDPETASLVQQHEYLIKELKDSLDENQKLLHENICALSDYGKRHPMIQEKVQTFIDGVFASEIEAINKIVDQPIIAMQDVGTAPTLPVDMSTVMAEYNAKKNELIRADNPTGVQDLVKWLSEKVTLYENAKAGVNDAVKSAYDSIISYYKQMLSDLASMPTPEALHDAALKEFSAIGFTDFVASREKKLLAKDAKGNDLEKVLAEAKALAAFHDVAEKELAAAGLKDFSDISKAIQGLNDNLRNERASHRIDVLMREPECKLTEAMRDWAIDFVKRDEKAFGEWYSGAPVAFSTIQARQAKTLASSTPGKSAKKYTKEQEDIAAQFGHNPDEVYGSQTPK